MRFKYKKFISTILVFQTVLLWCYILLRPTEDQTYKLTMLDNKPSNVALACTDHSKLITQGQRNMNLESKRVTKGDCIGVAFPVQLLQTDFWSAIDDAKNAFAFSAYMTNKAGAITVIGASIRSIRNVHCQYWHESPDDYSLQLQVQKAHVRLLPESHGNRYSGALFECPASSLSVNYISLVTKQCDAPFSLLAIQNATKPQTYKRKFTVCLKPLHFRYGRAYELVEWIELNKIIGAQKFIIYNYSSVVNVGDVLKHYVKQELVELVQWNLPIKSYSWPRTNEPVEIHSIGMLPMLQDCLFRSKQHSEFVINMDVDEFIIPRSTNVTTWSEMMDQIHTTADTYLFRNTFFRKEWNSSKIEFPEKRLTEKLKLVTLQTFERENRIFPPRSRSKYFTRTTKENSLMIHEVAGSFSHTVPVEVGLLHHYRNWQNYKDTSDRVTDDTVLQKYGKKLIDHVQSAWKELANVTMDIPI